MDCKNKIVLISVKTGLSICLGLMIVMHIVLTDSRVDAQENNNSSVESATKSENVSGNQDDVPLKINPVNGADGCAPCHYERKMYRDTSDGNKKYLWVDVKEFADSVHGSLGCVACHDEMNGGHHERPELVGEWKVLAGKRTWDANAIAACLNCHKEIGAQWKETVHGAAIFDEGIMQAADCADCHGYHYIKPVHDKGSPVNIENQPFTCATCHDQVAIVDRFGLSKNVFNTYKDSFHGKKQEIGGLSTIAVCASCHGVHDIYASKDPRSRVNDRNLAATCGECHYGSEYGFAQAFTHNPKPSKWQDVLLIIEQVYLYLIAISMSGFALHILLDYARTKRGGGHH